MKKTFWLRELVCLLKGEHGDINQAMQVLQVDGHLTVHLVTQLLRMFSALLVVIIDNDIANRDISVLKFISILVNVGSVISISAIVSVADISVMANSRHLHAERSGPNKSQVLMQLTSIRPLQTHICLGNCQFSTGK